MMRSIANNLRVYLATRRAARRYPVSLSVTVQLREAKNNVVSRSGRVATLSGATYDLSHTGLAFVVPTMRINNRYLTNRDYPLFVKVELPTGEVELEVEPVRHEQIQQSEQETGYLIGARILKMSETHRTSLIAYLETLTGWRRSSLFL